VEPIVLGPNPVHRFYGGGPAIAGFRGTPSADDHAPEDWVASATSVFGSEPTGLSTLPDGRTAAGAFDADPEAFFGPRHTERFGADPGLLVKLLEAGERLPVHCHPDREFARRHLDCPYGKTEAWVIVEVSPPGPQAEVFLGFRDEIDPSTLAAWVSEQDTSAILGAMHRVPVSLDDAVLVPAGLPHAVGEGVLLVELQEPTDLSVLLEWDGFDIDGARDGHMGLGFDAALRCVDRSGWGKRRLERLRTPREAWRNVRPGVDVLFPGETDPFFRAERIRPRDASPLPAGYSVLVVTRGRGRLEFGNDGSLELGRGATVMIPFAAGECRLVGSMEAVRCMPADPDAPDVPAPAFG
jgi:mannose-6-phosphate isomerase